jgi:F-type H+-transporting ATPase subunit b
MELLSPEINQMLWSFGAFIILLVLLGRFAFPPLLKMLKEREETIKQSLDKAEQTRDQAEQLMNDYKKQMAEARKEAQVIIEQGKKLAESMKEDIVKEAQAEASKTIERARQEINREKEKAFEELQSKMADMVVLTSTKVVGRSLDSADHLRLIKESLQEVDKSVEN